MAVQAQYPSNILLLNRNGQEGHDYSLQAQPGGLFHDQSSSMIFNNVGASTNTNINPRKRAREASITTPQINIFSLQQHQHQHQQQSSQPQLIDLSQLHNNHHSNQQQPNVVSTGLRLAFGEQQQQQQQQLQQRQQLSLASSLLPVLATEDFASHIKHQRDEVEQFLQAQGEQLRRTLAEKRQRHYRTLLCAAEESVARRLREKDEEVELASRRNAELEARAAQLGAEAQLWQAKARAHEATAAALQAQLQQAMLAPAHDNDAALSCAADAEDAESAYVDPDRLPASPVGPTCRACHSRAAAVLLLPCRHLCLCTDCDRVVQSCPVCRSFRNSSVEVFLS